MSKGMKIGKPYYDIEVGPETLHGKEGELLEERSVTLTRIIMVLLFLLGLLVLITIFGFTFYFLVNPI
jgi:hypothetical protein